MNLYFKILFFIPCFFYHLFAISQTDDKKNCISKDTNIYYEDEVDKVAEPKKNFNTMEFFISNFNYDEKIESNLTVVQFIIEKDGSISFPRYGDSPISDSVISVIKKLPKFKPAILKKKKVRSHYIFKVLFDVTENITINMHPDSKSETIINTCFITDNLEIYDSNSIYSVVQQMPKFPGGDSMRNMFIKNNLNYPSEAYENMIQGKIYVSFIVEKDGVLSDIKVVSKKRGFGLEEEALRLVSKMPKWIPGKQNGKVVRVLFYLPISFKISY